MKKSEPKSSTINIDKIFEEGREPTEEEWKEWAESFVPKRLSRRTAPKQTQIVKATAKQQIRDRENKRRSYQKKEEYKSWGDKYNQKRRYLYKYNKTWKANLEATQRIYKFGIDSTKYESWRGLYKRKYKYKLSEFAQTFKLAENVYVYGFTERLFQSIGPFSFSTYKKFKEDNLYPLPEFEGYRFKNNKISKTAEKFYLMTEAAAFFDFFMINKRKIGIINTDEKKLFVKKKLWESMLKAREDFNNE